MNIIQKHGLQDQLAQQLSAPAQTSVSSDDEVAQLRQEMQFQQEVNQHTIAWNELQRQHPDAADLTEVIVGQLTANPSWSIEQGYQAARELVDGLAKGKTAQAEAEAINTATKAAEKANRLNLPKGKTGTVAPPASSGNLRDDLTTAARQLGVKLN